MASEIVFSFKGMRILFQYEEIYQCVLLDCRVQISKAKGSEQNFPEIHRQRQSDVGAGAVASSNEENCLGTLR